MTLRDKITDTVNSLLNALTLPDETTEANQVLCDLRFPQFSRMLPYRDYDRESGLLIKAMSALNVVHRTGPRLLSVKSKD